MSFVEFAQQLRRNPIEGSQIAAQAIQPHHFSAEAIREYSLADGSVSSRTVASSLQSDNYVAGVSGWRIDRVTGDVEFGSGTFRGVVQASAINIPDTTTASSFHVDSTGRMWIGANASNFATAPFRVTAAGAVTATSITLTNPTITGPTVTNGSLSNTSIAADNTSTGDTWTTTIGAGTTSSGMTIVNSSYGAAGILADRGAFAGGKLVINCPAPASNASPYIFMEGDLAGASNRGRISLVAEAVSLVNGAGASASLQGLLSGWTSWTPQVDQGATTNIAKTVNSGRYLRIGSLVICYCYLTITGSGTAGNAITLSAPVTARVGAAELCGTGRVGDNGTGDYVGASALFSTTKIGVIQDGTGNWIGASPSFALANTDYVLVFACYEAA